MAFGSILSENSYFNIDQVIIPVLLILLEHVKNDSHDCVRSTSAWAIAKIAASHPNIIKNHFGQVIQTLIVVLSDEDPIIAYYSCFVSHILI